MIILAEGNIDVIALHQAASTALSPLAHVVDAGSGTADRPLY
jgi:hypothetical protein